MQISSDATFVVSGDVLISQLDDESVILDLRSEGYFGLGEVAEPMSRADALLALLRATFNSRVRDHARLRRQFSLASALATRLTVTRVIYPRALTDIDQVREAILATIDETGS